MLALLDTISEVTIADSAFARKMQWHIRPAKIASVKTASGEPMMVDGTCTTDLTVGRQRHRTNVFVTPDMEGLVLGADWKVVWDFQHRRVNSLWACVAKMGPICSFGYNLCKFQV